MNLMLSEIDLRLSQLIALWIDGTLACLRSIPPLCEEMLDEIAHDDIADLVAAKAGKLNIDPHLLQRLGRLASKGEQRLAVCLEIQSRTGCYSTDGALELSPRMATSGWEG